MTPEAAWQHTLNRLRTQISKAIFDSWVKQTRLLRVEERSGHIQFIIDAGGEYARDWLSQNMSATFSKLLSGYTGTTAQVSLCTENDPEYVSGERPPIQDIPALDANDVSAASARAEQAEMLLSEVRLSLRDMFVKHEREIAIPGYFRRWIPYLGPTLAWVVVAFRQAFYLKAGCQAKDGGEFSVRADQIIRWSGLARSTFWEAIKDSRLGWFIQQVSEGPRWTPDERTGQPRQKPNRYRFCVAMPLTPGDASTLAAWLEAAGIQSDPAAALRSAIACERGEILPDPAPQPQPHQTLPELSSPRSVHEVVHRMCGRLSRQTFAEVNALADELEAHLIPKNDLIFITWYFLQNWVPELGPGAAWLITLLRDQCYFSRNGGQNRDTVQVKGGAAALAAMLGLSRPKTVDEWLPPLLLRPNGGGDSKRLRRKSATRKKVACFLTRCNGNTKSGIRKSGTWQFQVTDYGAEPLIPDHQQAYQALLDIIGAYLESGDRDEVDALLASLTRARSGLSLAGFGRDSVSLTVDPGRVTDSQKGQSGRELDSHMENDGAKRTLNRARSGLVLKHLIKSSIDIESLTATITRLESLINGHDGKIFNDETVVVGGKWNIKRLLERSQIGAKKKLIEAGVTPEAYISRLLYLYSPLGEGLKDGRGWLVRSLLEGAQMGAGGSYDELASMTPYELGRLVQKVLVGWDGLERPVNDRYWDDVMRGGSRKRLEELAERLGIGYGDLM